LLVLRLKLRAIWDCLLKE